MSSADRGIRKEVCWISSNITESSHQVQAVLDAGILPPLLKLLESQDNACREDATWVLYNISSNHDMRQISYLADQHGIRALCNLLSCSKELDVLWKGCGTVAAVALKGLRNILVAGQHDAANNPNGYNKMAALVAEASGVERIEGLASHQSADVRQRARLLLERFFGAEPAPSSSEGALVPDDHTNAANAALAAAAASAASVNSSAASPGASMPHVSASHYPDPDVAAAAAAAIADPAAFAAAAAAAAAAASATATCSCPHPHPTLYADHPSHMLPPMSANAVRGVEPESSHAAAAAAAAHYHATAVVAAAAAASGLRSSPFSSGSVDHASVPASDAGTGTTVRAIGAESDANGPASVPSSSGSSTDSDPEDDDSDSDLLPPPPAPCNCVLCTDTSPLADRRPRKSPADSQGSSCGIGDGSAPASVKGGKAGARPNGGVGLPSAGLTQSGSAAADFPSSGNDDRGETTRTLCDFCSGGGRLGDGKAGLAAKLGRAVRLGHSHCVAILLSRMTWSQRVAATEAPALLHPGGGPPDSSVSSSLPAIVLAAHLGKPECLALLLRRCRPDLDATHGKKRLTPLAWAAHKGYYKCCELLLEHGAKAGAKCGECLTALHFAASGGGQLSICELLLKYSAPVNAKSSKDQTPLCLATQKGYSRLVRLLLENGGDYNNEDESKITPLHIAASHGYAGSADELLRHGATIESKTKTGVTPLHYAVQGGHASVVKLLVAAGAVVNCTRKPLLIIAADDGNRQVVQILLDALAAIDCTANIKANLDKDTEIHDKLTPLHLASSRGHKDVVSLLLRRGATVDMKTEKGGWTALDFAVLNSHSACALGLLEQGATVTDNVKKHGQSGLTLVQHAARSGSKDVVRMLILRLREQKQAARGTAGDVSSELASSRAPPSLLSLATGAGPLAGNGPSYGTDDPDGPGNVALPPVGLIDGQAHEGLPVTGNNDAGCGSSSCDDDAHYHQQHHETGVAATTGASHRYDPRSSAGDESGFGTGPGYGNGPSSIGNATEESPEADSDDVLDGPASTTSASSTTTPGRASSGSNARRRGGAKDDQILATRQRERELKRRESEAAEARQRLDEAIDAQSIKKLTEAIDHVSKLVLQLGVSAVTDPVVPGVLPAAPPLSSIDDPYSGFSTDNGIDITSGASGAGAASNPVGNTTQAASASQTAAFQMEAGLGLEVQRARQALAVLQAKDRLEKEKRSREVTESKRDTNQQNISKAITAVLEGGEIRYLTRAVTRAKRVILEDDDPFVLEANAVEGIVVAAEKAFSALDVAVKGRSLVNLGEAIDVVKKSASDLSSRKGQLAAVRYCGGRDPADVVAHAEKLLDELVKERNSAEAQQVQAQAQEEAAVEALKVAVASSDLSAIESRLEEATSGLVSKQSDAASIIESARKSFAKSLKSERRKLRQASTSKDVEKIEVAVTSAKALNILALLPDVEAAVDVGEKLREQESCRADLAKAVADSDVDAIAGVRRRLQGLGMFAEAETARAEMDNLQKASRAESLLSTALNESQASVTAFKKSPMSSDEAVSEWTWPDGQRLCDLVKRSKGNFGGRIDRMCKETEHSASDLAVSGRAVVRQAVESGDTRALAEAIAGYEKSFVNVDSPAMFDSSASSSALSSARKRLSSLQAKEQENIKAEAALVKTEYNLANSRRTARHNRTHPRRSRGTVGSGATRSDSIASSNSSDDDTLDADIALSGLDGGTRGGFSNGRLNGSSSYGSLLESDCSHFYMWKEGTTVQCSRCLNIRESVNGDWLQRVKKRGSKAPSESGSIGPSTGNNMSSVAPPFPSASVRSSNSSSSIATAASASPGVKVRSTGPVSGQSPIPNAARHDKHGGGHGSGGPLRAPVSVAARVGIMGASHQSQHPQAQSAFLTGPPSQAMNSSPYALAEQQRQHQQRQNQGRQSQEQYQRLLRPQGRAGVVGGPTHAGHFAPPPPPPSHLQQRAHMAPQGTGPPMGLVQPTGRGVGRGNPGHGRAPISSGVTGADRLSSMNAPALPGLSSVPAGTMPPPPGMTGMPGMPGTIPPPPGMFPSGTRRIPGQSLISSSAFGGSNGMGSDEGAADLSMDFANENFGFDIDSLLGKSNM